MKVEAEKKAELATKNEKVSAPTLPSLLVADPAPPLIPQLQEEVQQLQGQLKGEGAGVGQQTPSSNDPSVKNVSAAFLRLLLLCLLCTCCVLSCHTPPHTGCYISRW